MGIKDVCSEMTLVWAYASDIESQNGRFVWAYGSDLIWTLPGASLHPGVGALTHTHARK